LRGIAAKNDGGCPMPASESRPKLQISIAADEQTHFVSTRRKQ
jgi:hypothetical protein